MYAVLYLSLRKVLRGLKNSTALKFKFLSRFGQKIKEMFAAKIPPITRNVRKRKTPKEQGKSYVQKCLGLSPKSKASIPKSSSPTQSTVIWSPWIEPHDAYFIKKMVFDRRFFIIIVIIFSSSRYMGWRLVCQKCVSPSLLNAVSKKRDSFTSLFFLRLSAWILFLEWDDANGRTDTS